MIRYLVAWLGLCAIAIANGALREAWFIPRTTAARAHQLSTATLLLAFAFYLSFVFRRWPAADSRHALRIGAMWLILTLAFEFGLGLSTGETFQQMLAAYDITRGNLWPLIPLFVAAAPYLDERMRARFGRSPYNPRPHG